MQGTQGLPTGRLDRYYKDGVVFVTYSTLISKGGRDGRGAAVKLPNEPLPEGGFADGSDSDDDNEVTDEFGMPGVWRHAPSCWSQCSCSRRLALGILSYLAVENLLLYSMSSTSSGVHLTHGIACVCP